MDATRFSSRNWFQLYSAYLVAFLLLAVSGCKQANDAAQKPEADAPQTTSTTTSPATTAAPTPDAVVVTAPESPPLKTPPVKMPSITAAAVEASPVEAPAVEASADEPAVRSFTSPAKSFTFAANEETGADDDDRAMFRSFKAFGAAETDDAAAADVPRGMPAIGGHAPMAVARTVINSAQATPRRSFQCDYSFGEDELHPQERPAAAVAGFGNGVFKGGNGYTTVKVFYATDRARFDYDAVSHAAFLPVLATLSAILTVIAGIAAAITIHGRGWLGWATTATFFLTVIFSALSWLNPLPPPVLAGRPLPVRYTGARGELEMGVCEIGVPQDHSMGHVETPSFFKFEVSKDPSQHVRLKQVTTKKEDEFFADLHSTVDRSPRKEILVFVHGYNVGFTDAARRTAQIAYDLEFQGAPMFFSWPSQNGLLGYTVDENNVAWATPHLKQFLLDVAEKSDASAIHLIAHSMGNRALTGALRELALEYQEDARLFNQVVLAAPDVDAEIFKRDIAPQITRTADRVTLYASSNDRALKASKSIHGYPRAGESGTLIMIAPGIETIDVSALDTSFLGHSYYGDSDSIIADMHHLFHNVRSARERVWLTAMNHGGQTYWEFRQKVAVARRNGAADGSAHSHAKR